MKHPNEVQLAHKVTNGEKFVISMNVEGRRIWYDKTLSDKQRYAFDVQFGRQRAELLQ